MVGTRVRNKTNNKTGVVVPDENHLCASDEVMVRLDGASVDLTTRISELESINGARSHSEEANSNWLYWK
jgi:hypothetical protein